MKIWLLEKSAVPNKQFIQNTGQQAQITNEYTQSIKDGEGIWEEWLMKNDHRKCKVCYVGGARWKAVLLPLAK